MLFQLKSERRTYNLILFSCLLRSSFPFSLIPQPSIKRHGHTGFVYKDTYTKTPDSISGVCTYRKYNNILVILLDKIICTVFVLQMMTNYVMCVQKFFFLYVEFNINTNSENLLKTLIFLFFLFFKIFFILSLFFHIFFLQVPI